MNWVEQNQHSQSAFSINTQHHKPVPNPNNIEKPALFEAFQLEMLKNRQFLKLSRHHQRYENDSDSFLSPNMRKKEHKHNRNTAPEMRPRPAAQGLRQRAGGKDYVSS